MASLVWSWYAVPSLAAGLVGLALAAALLVVGRQRAANRRLALVLGVEALLMGLGGSEYFVRSEEAALRLHQTVAALFILTALAYLNFIALLDTPLVAWLRTRAARAALLASGAAAILMTTLRPELMLAKVEYLGGGNWAWAPSPEAYLLFIVYPALLGAIVFAFAAALHAARRSPPGSVTERRGRYYATAFGVRDGTVFVVVILAFLLETAQTESRDFLLWGLAYPVGLLSALLLLAYGILKTQLFDIDLRIKWTIKSGTIASLFVGGFFAAYKITEFYLGREVGWIFGGALSGVFFFLAPRLNRLADKVAEKAAPKVQPTSEYLTYRKLEVYRAALEGAMEDGEVNQSERAILARLRAKLGIGEADAEALEREVVESLGHAVAATPATP